MINIHLSTICLYTVSVFMRFCQHYPLPIYNIQCLQYPSIYNIRPTAVSNNSQQFTIPLISTHLRLHLNNLILSILFSLWLYPLSLSLFHLSTFLSISLSLVSKLYVLLYLLVCLLLLSLALIIYRFHLSMLSLALSLSYFPSTSLPLSADIKAPDTTITPVKTNFKYISCKKRIFC